MQELQVPTNSAADEASIEAGLRAQMDSMLNTKTAPVPTTMKKQQSVMPQRRTSAGSNANQRATSPRRYNHGAGNNRNNLDYDRNAGGAHDRRNTFDRDLNDRGHNTMLGAGNNHQFSATTKNRQNDLEGAQIQIDRMAVMIMQDKGFHTAVDFFKPFDVYAERVLEAWELELIINQPKYGTRGMQSHSEFEAAFRFLNEANQHENSKGLTVGAEIVQLQFLIQKIEQSREWRGSSSNFQLPSHSTYASKMVSPQTEASLQNLALDRDIMHSPAQAWDRQYPGSVEVTKNEFKKILQKAKINASDHDINEFFQYFCVNPVSVTMHKIEFRQGMRRFVHFTPRYPNQVNPFSSSAMQHQQLNTSGYQQPQMPNAPPPYQPHQNYPPQQVPYGQQQPAPYGQQPLPYGQQQPAPYGQQPLPYGQQQPAPHGQHPAPYGQQQQPPYGQQHLGATGHNQFAQQPPIIPIATNSDPEIDRIIQGLSEWMKSNGKTFTNVFFKQRQNYDNTQALLATDFQYCMGNSVSAYDQKKLSDHFVCASSRLNPSSQQYVDMVAFENAFKSVDFKFQGVIQQNRDELFRIQQALRSRHSGVYAWFSQQSGGRGDLSYDSFDRAITALNCVTVTNQARQSIFNGIDTQKKQMITAAEIEQLFKSFNKSENAASFANVELVLQQIVKAFNGDDKFVQDELIERKKRKYGMGANLPNNEFIDFFRQFDNYAQYFTLEDIQLVAEKFTMQFSEVDVDQFVQELVKAKNRARITREIDRKGIHEEQKAKGSNYGPSPDNFMMPDFTSDCTRASQGNRIPLPRFFEFKSDRELIESVVKACYMQSRIVEDHFQSYERSARPMSQQDFEDGCVALQLDNITNNSRVRTLFVDVDLVSNGGQQVGTITAKQVDQFISWYPTKSSIEESHDALLDKINGDLQHRNMQLSELFAQCITQSYGHPFQDQQAKTCTLIQLEEVLNKLSPNGFLRADIQFLARKYTPGARDQIHYIKFEDDIRNKQRRDKSVEQAAGYRTRQTSSEGLEMLTRKKCIVLGKQLNAIFAKKDMFQKIDMREFTAVFKDDLELFPTVTIQEIEAFYRKIDKRGYQEVTTGDIEREINAATQNKDQFAILQDIFTEVTRTSSNLTSVFQGNRYFQQDKGRMTSMDFKDVIINNARVSEIDAEFIEKFYSRGGRVNAQDFLNELSNPRVAPGTSYKDNFEDPLQKEIQYLLKFINQQVINQKGNLHSDFSNEARGRDTLRANDFFYCLEKYYRVKPAEKTLLQGTYEKGYKSGQIDYLKFSEDLKELRDDERDAVALTAEQSKIYKGMRKHLTDNNLNNLLAYNLKKYDHKQNGYITEEEIASALNDTMNSLGGKKMKMSAKQMLVVCAPLSRGGVGSQRNYKDMLIHLFSKTQGRRLFDMDVNTLRDLSKQVDSGYSQTGAKMHTHVKAAANDGLRSIAEQILAQKKDIEHYMKERMGPNARDTKLHEDIIAKVLKSPGECNVTLSHDERHALETWCAQQRDSYGNIDVGKFLNAIGLPPLSLDVKHVHSVPKKILDNAQLRDCQLFLTDLYHSLKQRGIEPENIVHQNRRSETEKGVDPVTFKRILLKEMESRMKPRLTDVFLLDLTAYLSSEEVGIISFRKLLQAMSLSDNDPPLAQDGVEELRGYQNRLKQQIDSSVVPFEVIDLNSFMQREKLSISSMFQLQGTQLNKDIAVGDFAKRMNEAGFVPKDKEKLIIALDEKGTRTRVSMKKLNAFIKQLNGNQGAKLSKTEVLSRMQGFDQTVQNTIRIIEQFIKAPAQGWTTKHLHELLDANRDGTVDKDEFCDGITGLGITGVNYKKCADIFDAIDINNDKFLSVHEFSMFIEGTTEQRDKRAHELDPETRNELKEEIEKLFRFFDKDESRTVTSTEIFNAMKTIGHQITEQRAQEMISQVDKNGDGSIDIQEFEDLMMPIMVRELFQNEQKMGELREMFVAADMDHSGFLSIEELYSCLRSSGINVEQNELIELMQEFDNDKDAQLDIDEFMAMMTMGDDLAFRTENAKNTYLKIKKGRRLNVTDFLKAFGNLPTSFIPSIFQERWRLKKNLPSSVFRAQIDPRTMMWKDIMPVVSDNLYGDQRKGEFKPLIRPFPSLIASQITIEECTGVPLPKDEKFDRNSICKRAVRVGLWDYNRKDYIMNTVQVLAKWENKAEDQWQFNTDKQAGQNPLMFRTTMGDNLDPEKVSVIFELVIYVKDMNTESTVEMSCGWAEVPLSTLETDITKVKFDIQGGCPKAEVGIDPDAINTKRTGFKGFLSKITNNKITSSIVLSLRPLKTFTQETKFHMELMPSTCLIQKKLLYFVSGFRNYAGDRLLSQRTLGQIRKPGGSVVISSFPKLLDNPDINEILSTIWHEDVMEKMTSAAQKKNIDLIISKMKDFCHRLYPVLYSQDFNFSTTKSACADRAEMEKINKLLSSALRFGQQGLAGRRGAVDPPTSQTTYKPFNVREIEFDVWDAQNAQEAKQDRYLNLYQQSGHLDQRRHGAPRNLGAAQVQKFLGNTGNAAQQDQYANRAFQQ